MSHSIKSRFDGLDVTAMAAHLRNTLLGRRVVNIYDGDDGSTYIFKLDGEGKAYFLIESGIRFHPLDHFAAEGSASMPTPYCAKLRKHLRGLRLENVQQLGTDRVCLFHFGVGAARHSLILELYSKGNLIMTDHEYVILALLRSHIYETNEQSSTKRTNLKTSDDVAVRVGRVYPVAYATTTGKNDESTTASILATEWIQQQILEHGQQPNKKKGALNLKTLLLKPSSGVSQYGPALLEHCILKVGLEPHKALRADGGLSSDDWDRLKTSLQQEGSEIMGLLQKQIDAPGYILYRDRANTTNKEFAHADKVLEEFVPHLLLQHQKRPHLEYESFGAAVSDFFANISQQKRLLKTQAAERAAQIKLEKIRKHQEDRLKALENEIESLQLEARAVQQQADSVDKALLVINSALDSGMDWDQLKQLVEVEQNNQNSVALLIERLDLEKDAMVLRLPSDPFDENSETLKVRVSLKLTAHANANFLFDKFRAAKDKAAKTIEASSTALQAAEESAKRQLEVAQKRNKYAETVMKRKPLWFEKFHWFVTSENYLVLGGKDAHQNETLVKRYLRPGDAYLHADVHGAASCILRAKRRRREGGKTDVLPLSEQALREAGNFTICRSSAWSRRIVTSAWWVESHQVSKTAPSGEYLTVGSFMIRGKKNFLPPSQLEMGLAVLFRLGDDDVDGIARHKNERRDFALLELESSPEKGSNGAFNDDVGPYKSTHASAESSFQDINGEPAGGFNNDPDGTDYCNANGGSLSSSEQENDELIDVEQREPSDRVQQEKQNRGLSVRDRKLIRKYGSLEVAEGALNGKDDCEESKKQSSEPSVASARRMKRGKKAKLKKAMKKYADQDEEERALAMLALQGGEKAEKFDRQATSKSLLQTKMLGEAAAFLMKDANEVATRLPSEVQSLLKECVSVKQDDGCICVRWDKFDADILDKLVAIEPLEAQVAVAERLLSLMNATRVDNIDSCLAGIIRRVQKHGYSNLSNVMDTPVASKRKSKEEKRLEGEQRKELLVEEGDSDDAVDETKELSMFTGKPHPDDLLLYAIPVCAPYQTVSQYTYRVKLVPGNMKRGKAAKQCLEMLTKHEFSKPSTKNDRCVTLIKQVIDNDWLQVISSDVKLSAPGSSKVTKKMKTNKKSTKKK